MRIPKIVSYSLMNFLNIIAWPAAFSSIAFLIFIVMIYSQSIFVTCIFCIFLTCIFVAITDAIDEINVENSLTKFDRENFSKKRENKNAN